ncbi:MAG: iron ABC transporter permease, partial [Alkalinema sp. CAN_BIN05]|nr:iron ABC transporter permease [Alkalinema sp. CAN_BIN05]
MVRKLTTSAPQVSSKSFSIWTIVTVSLALLMMLPLVSVLSSVFSDTRTVWQHLITTVLGEYILNSLILMVGVATGVAIVGTSCAWLVTMCQFRGRSLFQWALLLPLAAPA